MPTISSGRPTRAARSSRVLGQQPGHGAARRRRSRAGPRAAVWRHVTARSTARSCRLSTCRGRSLFRDPVTAQDLRLSPTSRAEQVVDGLAAHDDPGLRRRARRPPAAAGCGCTGWTGTGSRRPCPARRAGRPARRQPGRNSSLTTMSPLSQCLPTTRASTGVGAGGAARPGCTSSWRRRGRCARCRSCRRRPRRRRATAPPSRSTGLTVPDLVEREGARPGDGPAGLDRDAGHGDAVGAALALDDLGHAGGEALRRQRVVLGRVGDAEAAAEVELGRARPRAPWRSACAGRAPRRADTSKPAVSKICEPMWLCSPSSRSVSGRAEDAARRLEGVRRPAEREAELLVLVGRRDELVGVRLDADGDADHAPARRPELGAPRPPPARSRRRSRR